MKEITLVKRVQGDQKSYKQTIGNYFSESVPNVGDVILYANGRHYTVLSVIRKVGFAPTHSSLFENEVIIEVKLCNDINIITRLDERR